MVEYIKSNKPEDKLKLGTYSLAAISGMAINDNAAKTSLSIDFDHKEKRYRAKVVITQKEIK